MLYEDIIAAIEAATGMKYGTPDGFDVTDTEDLGPCVPVEQVLKMVSAANRRDKFPAVIALLKRWGDDALTDVDAVAALFGETKALLAEIKFGPGQPITGIAMEAKR